MALGLALLGFLSACGSDPPPGSMDVKAIEAEGKDFIDTVPAMQPLFLKDQTAATAKFRVEVFVDQSASMHGYVDYEHNWAAGSRPARTAATAAARPAPGQDRPPASSFVRLLRELANEEELLGFFGFGSDASGVQTIAPLGTNAPVDPRQYVRLNNDYADLLQQFASRPPSADGQPIERIIITDGVQSHHDFGSGSALNQTVQRLQAWTDKGGIVEVRLLTAPFAGTYYSEELRARRLPVSFGGRTAERPFIAISLLTGRADLPAWDRFWGRNALSDLSTKVVLRWPVDPVVDRAVTLTPEERIPKDIPVDVLYRNVWDLSSVVTLDGYRDLWRAFVHRTRTQTEPDPATYPACFLLKGIRSGSEADAAEELRSMKPTLEVWQRPAPPRKGPAATPPAAAAGKEWRQVETVDLRDFHNGKVSVTPTAAPAGAFRFTATLGIPARNTVQAVVLTATPPFSRPPPPDWKTFSTLDDSSPGELGRIYNLQPFVEQLTDQSVRAPTPDGLLVLTYR